MRRKRVPWPKLGSTLVVVQKRLPVFRIQIRIILKKAARIRMEDAGKNQRGQKHTKIKPIPEADVKTALKVTFISSIETDIDKHI